ncbi:hypothetical protein CXG81DRAFT_25920 [Caulochytrium protostelioides]|nr:hypothetical protein CXG81DRAFT_25920 [Caulochytrium protostelioides]|eukprot:RKP01371.1 hypothetical protein CXG81DRAFT_25920 [Caulochytrium protostelioides]
MTVVQYFLCTEAALVLLISVPINIPVRRRVLDFLRNNPRLKKLRWAYHSLNAFWLFLFVDAAIRLRSTDSKILALTGDYGDGNVAQSGAPMTGGAGAPAGTAAPMAAAAGGGFNVMALQNLNSQRYHLLSDLYVLAFTLFCSLVLWQLQLTMMRMGRYREERNALRAMLKNARADATLDTLDALDGVPGVDPLESPESLVAGGMTPTLSAAAPSSKAGLASAQNPLAVPVGLKEE